MGPAEAVLTGGASVRTEGGHDNGDGDGDECQKEV